MTRFLYWSAAEIGPAIIDTESDTVGDGETAIDMLAREVERQGDGLLNAIDIQGFFVGYDHHGAAVLVIDLDCLGRHLPELLAHSTQGNPNDRSGNRH